MPWATDEDLGTTISRTPRPADRLILLALRLHDLEPTNVRGACPGYRRLAVLTGLAQGTVRNRLSALVRARAILARRHGQLASYFIVPSVRPVVIASGDMSPREMTTTQVVTKPDDMHVIASDDNLAVVVIDVSPSLVHSKGKETKTSTARPKRSRRATRASHPDTSHLLAVIVQVGLHGVRPDYARLGAVAKRLLDHYPVTEIESVIHAMRERFPWSDGRAFDLFDVERNIDKVRADLAARASTVTSGVDNADEALAARRRA